MHDITLHAHLLSAAEMHSCSPRWEVVDREEVEEEGWSGGGATDGLEDGEDGEDGGERSGEVGWVEGDGEGEGWVESGNS